MSALPTINPEALTAREVELLREIRVNFDTIYLLNTTWRNEARALLLRIEQAAGVASVPACAALACANRIGVLSADSE